eukprot:UC4_evm5s1393
MIMFLLLLLFTGEAEGTDSTVYMIRHGEKKSTFGCLNDQGLARARAICNIFDGMPSPLHETFETPQALYANHYDDPIDCERCRQTLLPISQHLRLPINFNYGYTSKLGGNQRAADAIRLHTHNTTNILVAWEHVNIKYLTADLGVDRNSIPTWSGSDFDTVYILRFTDGTLHSFSIAHENYTAPIIG